MLTIYLVGAALTFALVAGDIRYSPVSSIASVLLWPAALILMALNVVGYVATSPTTQRSASSPTRR